MNTKMKASLLAGTIMTGAIFFASASQAQMAGSNNRPDSSTPAAAPDAGVLQEIVVTAQRKSENLQRAPIAITAVSGEQLRDAGVVSATDLTVLVPALQVPAAGVYPLY